MRKLIFALLGAPLLLFLFANSVLAETITVCPDDGVPENRCNHETIVSALAEASAGDVIQVAVEGEFTEDNIIIETSVTIEGYGPDRTLVKGSCNGRIFENRASAVTLRAMTIQDGCALEGDGGGILNGGELSLEEIVVRDNTAQGRGGGIYNVGRLKIEASAVFNNEAAGSGGGLYNSGFITHIHNSTISGNATDQLGGGIFNNGFISGRYLTVFDNLNRRDGSSNLYNHNEGEFISAASIIHSCRGKNLIVSAKSLSLAAGCGLEVAQAPLFLARNEESPQAVPALVPDRSGAAFDAIDCGDVNLPVDQARTPRPQGSACDLGATELPLSLLPFVGRPKELPDLRIVSLTADPDSSIRANDPISLSVIIENRGLITAEHNIWVDLYINPHSPPPNEAGTPWSALCPEDECLGLAWRVTKALAPGDVVTLTSTYLDDNQIAILDPSQSNWHGTFHAGGNYELWAFVDSWNGHDKPTGVAAELNETNNRFGPVRIFANECDCPQANGLGEAKRTIPDRPLPSEFLKP